MRIAEEITQNTLDRIAQQVKELEHDWYANKEAGFEKDADRIGHQLDGIVWVLGQLGYDVYHASCDAEPEIKTHMWCMNH